MSTRSAAGKADPDERQPRTYVTEVSVPHLGDGGIQRMHSRMLDPEPPAIELEAGS